jgi:hypothetical protein
MVDGHIHKFLGLRKLLHFSQRFNEEKKLNQNLLLLLSQWKVLLFVCKRSDNGIPILEHTDKSVMHSSTPMMCRIVSQLKQKTAKMFGTLFKLLLESARLIDLFNHFLNTVKDSSSLWVL